MGRLPKIIIMILAMTAIFLWMSTAFNSCGDKDDILDDMPEKIEEIVDDTDEFVDDIFEDDDLFEDSEEDIDYSAGDEAVDADFTDYETYSDEDTYTSTSNDTQTTTTSYSSNSSGSYMVIAGNYLVESNARSMTKKLANLGYPNAEIGIFDRSQYHTVIASRHESYAAAAEVSNAIQRQGIESYVKKKQY